MSTQAQEEEIPGNINEELVLLLTQREASGVDVHLGEAQVFQRGGQGEGGLHGDVAQQVRLLAALLQLVCGVVQHLLVPVAHLLHFQPVDLPAQTNQLTGQTVVLHLHLPLRTEQGGMKGVRLSCWGGGVEEKVLVSVRKYVETWIWIISIVIRVDQLIQGC